MNRQLEEALGEVAEIYGLTKGYVIRCEELDRENKSNISIIKEQRDALDHVVRALADEFDQEDEGHLDYQATQIDKAKGHLFRAAYDTLDGMVLICKQNLAEALDSVGNKCISEVFPGYYHEVVPTISKLEKEFTECRRNKDVGKGVKKNLAAYMKPVEELIRLTDKTRGMVPSFQEWTERDRVERRKKKHKRAKTG